MRDDEARARRRRRERRRQHEEKKAKDERAEKRRRHVQRLLATQVEAQQLAQAERHESRAQKASDFTRRGFDGGLGALPAAPPTGFRVAVAAEPSWRAQPRPPLVVLPPPPAADAPRLPVASPRRSPRQLLTHRQAVAVA